MQKKAARAMTQRHHTAVPVVLIVAGSVGLAALGTALGYAATHRRQIRDHIRSLDKQQFNRFVLAFAGRAGIGYAALYHTGRTSGKTYATPLVAEPTPTGFLIPLPYGSETDWCLNVRQAEGAVLKKGGTTYLLSQPEIVNEDFAQPLLPERARRMFHICGIRAFLHVRAEPMPDPITADTLRQEIPV